MFDNPSTREEARKIRYGCWAGEPKGRRYREADCAYEVFPQQRGGMHHQCCKGNGFGPGLLYCRQHANKVTQT